MNVTGFIMKGIEMQIGADSAYKAKVYMNNSCAACQRKCFFIDCNECEIRKFHESALANFAQATELYSKKVR